MKPKVSTKILRNMVGNVSECIFYLPFTEPESKFASQSHQIQVHACGKRKQIANSVNRLTFDKEGKKFMSE